jgi:hypothetical protein
MAVNSSVCEYSVWLIDRVWIDVWRIAGKYPPVGMNEASSKSNASAVSRAQAVLDSECTIFGKPYDMGENCPKAAGPSEARNNAQARAGTSTSNAPAIAFLIDQTIPFDYHWESIMSAI